MANEDKKDFNAMLRTKIAAYTDRVYIETVWGCGYKWLK